MDVSLGLPGNELGPSQRSCHRRFEASRFVRCQEKEEKKPEKEEKTGPSTEIKGTVRT
jgi:hypothetical protein